MKSNRSTLLAISIVGVLALLLYLLFSMQSEHFNWNPTFSDTGEQPYDLSLFKKTLEGSMAEGNFKELKSIADDSVFLKEKDATFFWAAEYANVDSTSARALLSFADAGNTVFISAQSNYWILKILYPYCIQGDSSLWDFTKAKNAKLKLEGAVKQDSATIFYNVVDEKIRNDWAYFNFEDCPKGRYKTLGNFESIGKTYPNFIEIKQGEGKLLLHSTPLGFTNYHFREKPVFGYVQALMSYLPEGKLYYYTPEYESFREGDPMLGESPLRFILANPPLKWAWYLLIFITLLFVLNTMRRTQKTIPIFALPDNETANYLDVVSRLYQKEGKHKHIIAVQEKMLRRHLHNKYRLPSHKINEHFYDEAETKLQIPKKRLKETFSLLESAKNNSSLNDEEFRSIDQLIKDFYSRCP